MNQMMARNLRRLRVLSATTRTPTMTSPVSGGKGLVVSAREGADFLREVNLIFQEEHVAYRADPFDIGATALGLRTAEQSEFHERPPVLVIAR